MPIPLIVWIIGLGVAALYGDKIIEKVTSFLNSDDGKKMMSDINKAVEGELAPYEKIIQDAYYKETEERKCLFVEMKKRMTEFKWSLLVNCGKIMSKNDARYIAVYADLLHADKQ